MSIRPGQGSNLASPLPAAARSGPAGQPPTATSAVNVVADTRVAAAAPTIKVDAAGRLGPDGTLAVTGQVALSRVFMDRLLRQITRNPKRFGPTLMAFDPRSQSYAGRVKLHLAGLTITLVGGAVPTLVQNQPGFRLVRPGLAIGPWTLHPPGFTWLVTRAIARAISNDTVHAQAGRNGAIGLEPTGLLHDIGVLPPDVALDSHTRFGVATDRQGAVTVTLTSDVPAPGGPASGRSNVSLSLNEAAVLDRLRPLLAPNFDLQRVRLADHAIALVGQVEAKPVSDIVNGVRGLLGVLVAAQTGHAPSLEPDHVMLPLTLNLRFDGDQVVLSPSMGAALGPLEKSLTQAGLKPRREGDALRFDRSALGNKYGLTALDVTPGQLSLRASLDVPSLVSAPILRGER